MERTYTNAWVALREPMIDAEFTCSVRRGLWCNADDGIDSGGVAEDDFPIRPKKSPQFDAMTIWMGE